MFEDIIKKSIVQGLAGLGDDEHKQYIQDERFVDVIMRVFPSQKKVFLSLLGENPSDKALAVLEDYVMITLEEYNELKGGKNEIR